MPDDVVGSARIRIEPDLTGFDAALEQGVQQAADQAAEVIVAAFRQAAATSAQELSEIGAAGFVDVTQTADTAATDLEAAFASAAADADAALGSIGAGAGGEIVAEFDGTGAAISGELTAGAAEATEALEGIGAGAGDEIVDEFAGVGASIAGDIEAGANEAQASLEGIGAGAGDQLAGEFAGAGEAISSTVQSGASDASAALSALEGAGQGVVENLAQNFEGLGGVIAAAIGGVALASAFSAAEHVASVAGVTNRLIETTGGVANVTSDELLGLGDSLERVVGIESELVQEAGNVLLTFKNVRNEVGAGNDIFDRAIRAGADLSAVLGGEITGSALQLGKALQEPVRGLSLLGRAGVSFTTEQKELVRSLVEEGDLLAAQKIILGEVESQVGGAAEASAKASDRIRASLGNLSEEFGAGLLPAAETFADRLPDIVSDIGPEIRELGAALGEGLEVGIDALLAMAPLLGTTTDLLVALTPALELAVDLVDAIPDPLLQAAAAIYTVNKALALMKVASLLGAGALGKLALPAGAVSGAFNIGAKTAPGFAGALKGVTTGLSGATLAAGLGLTAVSMYSDMMGKAQAEGEAFAQGIRDDFDLASMSTEELAGLSERLGTEVGNLRSQVDDSFFGRNTINKDFNETIKTGADELERFQDEVDAARIEMLRLEAEAKFGGVADQFVGVADAIAVVRSESDESADAINRFRQMGEVSDIAFLGLATTLGDAALSEEAMAEAAQALGTDVESLTGFIEGVNGALDGFIDTALNGLPQIAGAFRDSNDDAQVSAREFITGLNEDALELATFFGDIKAITEAGFAEVAGTLTEQGVEIAGVAAHELAEAARKGNVELLLRTQEGLNNRNNAIAQGTSYVERILGPAFVTANGTIAREATEAFGENFSPEEQVRIAGELAATGLDEEGQRIAAIAATQGAAAAREFGKGLNLDQAVIDEAAAAGVAIRNHAPLEAARLAGVDMAGALSDGIVAGVQFNLDDMVQAGIDLYKSIETGVREAGVLFSPSRKMMEIGRMITAGFVQGVSSDSGQLSAAGAGLFDAVESGVVGGLMGGLDAAGAEVVKAAEKIVADAAESIGRARLPGLDVRLGEQGMVPQESLSSMLALVNQTPAFAGPGTIAGGTGLVQQVTFEAGAIVNPDPLAAADTVAKRLKAEAFLQMRS